MVGDKDIRTLPVYLFKTLDLYLYPVGLQDQPGPKPSEGVGSSPGFAEKADE
jgi:hypothetical protein